MVGIIPKPTKKLPEWQNFVFYIAPGILVLLILAYAALFYFEAKASTKMTDLEDQIAKVSTKEEKAQEREVVAFQKQISDFSLLFKEYQEPTKLFEFLEETCHPKIWFTEFSFIAETREVQLLGVTTDFETLGQQLLIFKDQDLIESINLFDLGINKEGNAAFAFQLSFSPEIFNE